MPSKSKINITETLSTEDLSRVCIRQIRKFLADLGIKKQTIVNYMRKLSLELLELQTQTCPVGELEYHAIQIEETSLRRRFLERLLSLPDGDYPDERPEMPYNEDPTLQPVVIEQPIPETTEITPNYIEIIPGKKKRGKRYIN